MPKKFIGKNIRFLRKLHRISQQGIATATGLTRNNIASYEMGKVEPKAENLLKIARYFNIDPYWFLSKNLEEEMSNTQEVNGESVSEKFASNAQGKAMTLEDFIEKNEDMQKVLEGFKEFYQFQFNLDEESSKEIQNLANNLESLLELMSDLLQTNFELIKRIQGVIH